MKSKKSNKYVWDEEFVTEELTESKITLEEIKLKNDLIKQQEKIMKRRSKKYDRYSVITAIIVFILLLVFVPFIRIEEIKMSKTNYLTVEEIYNVSSYDQKRFSLLTIYELNREVKESTDFIDTADLAIDFKEKIININIKEDTLLAVDERNVFYFMDGDEIITRENLQLSAPFIIGFTDEKRNELLKQLNQIDYSVLMSIESITYAPNEENTNYLEMKMNDGINIGISIEQISAKLPYYLQMSAIIEQKAANKDGKLHLDLGDYYEPK